MKRITFILLLAALAIYGWYRWSARDRIAFTPATKARLESKDVPHLTALDGEYTRLIQAVGPSVVSITTARRVQQTISAIDFLRGRRGGTQVQKGIGSGVIVSKEGHILTNHHVIAEMEAIQVQLNDGRAILAKLIGSDPQVDIAVLKIDAEGLEPLALGDSDLVKPGQLVFAIGNPYGFQESVSSGIVSAVGQRVRQDSGLEFLQTDAAVNPGNSGGPLINVRGEVVGINTLIRSNSGGFEGISFAIPANVARRTLDAIVKSGRVTRVYLGLTMMNLTPELARQFNGGDQRGVLVTDLSEGSPAERAGLQPGDVIREINGRAVADVLAVRERVVEIGLGGAAEIGFLRAGKKMKATMQVSEAPAGLLPFLR